MWQIKIPPIYIQTDKHWKTTLENIRTHLNKDVNGKLAGELIHINLETADDYRKILQYLDKKIGFQTFNLKQDVPKKCVIRGLPMSTQCDEIHELLQERVGIKAEVIKVSQLANLYMGKLTPLPLFLITFTTVENDMLNDIMKMHDLMGLKLTIETYKGCKGPLQCYTCQSGSTNH